MPARKKFRRLDISCALFTRHTPHAHGEIFEDSFAIFLLLMNLCLKNSLNVCSLFFVV
uniref:Uncharacterized protein n=1 Tax=Octopus bimaculoides TaxID=37653 RepID=A0A0L8G9U3_OCTBM